VIAVIGVPRLRGSGSDVDVAGLAAAISVAAAAAGSRVEFIGKTGDDRAGDAVLLALAQHGVGHAATLRDPARSTPVLPAIDEPSDLDGPEAASPGAASPSPAAAGPVLEPADVGLALRYLPELTAIVTVHAAADLVTEAVAASGWAQTSLIVVAEPDTPLSNGLPAHAIAVAVADVDDLEAGAGAAIGRYAAALDRGESAAEAYAALVATGTT
jgi:pfkB family carbohydrate kinase